jgi:3-hydroxyisobutyrate dehydrogenase
MATRPPDDRPEETAAMSLEDTTIGWIGAGRMGVALIRRLLDAGCDVAAWNRTRSKLDELATAGVKVVDRPVDLAERDIVVTMVSSSDVFDAVTLGDDGLLTGGSGPAVLIDSSTVSVEASERVRTEAAEVGTSVLAAPVSGNPKVVSSGRLTVVVSGPREAYERSAALLDMFGQRVTYVGEGERARLVKICHNLLLGIVTQSLAEITVLAERAGVPRHDFLEFLNSSVMGSTFSRYKTPALVNLDFTPTFTGHLLRKDFELGLEAGREFDVPLPVSALVHQMVVQLIGSGRGDVDFAALLELQAELSGVDLVPEDVDVSDGLTPLAPLEGA